MFRRPTYFFFALIVLVGAFSYWRFVRVSLEDIHAYETLVRESKEFHSRHALERQPAHQMREKVQKDIWVVRNGQRLHFRLNSAQSELILIQKKEKIEAIEKLKQFNCWMQDEMDPDGSIQQVRSLDAEEGIYTFPSHQFIAQSVNLAFFRLPGIELPSSASLLTEPPFFTGVATEARFSASDKLPTFTAYHLQARFDPQRGLP